MRPVGLLGDCAEHSDSERFAVEVLGVERGLELVERLGFFAGLDLAAGFVEFVFSRPAPWPSVEETIAISTKPPAASVTKAFSFEFIGIS